jgi:hypothetical protein
MSREVVTREDVQRGVSFEAEPAAGPGAPAKPAAAPAAVDEYADRLMKYIPGEVVSLFILLNGLASNAPEAIPKVPLQWFVFVFLLAGTWFYLWRVQKVTKRLQLVISTVAFAIWVFFLGGPFKSFSWYNEFYGMFLLPLYTFGVGLIEAKK